VLVAGKWSKAAKPKIPSCTFNRLKPGTYSVKVTATTVEGSTTAIKTGIRLAK
jgi:PKD repeat protein